MIAYIAFVVFFGCICLLVYYRLKVLHDQFIVSNGLKIDSGLPNDPDFYRGWLSEPLTNNWLKVSQSVIASMFKQSPETSHTAFINNVPVGMSSSTPLDEYYNHLTKSCMDMDAKITTSVNTKLSNDDKKFIKLHLNEKEVVKSCIRENDLDNVKMYHNTGLMVNEEFRHRGIGMLLMKNQLHHLNAYVFIATTNKYSSNIMKKCGCELIKSWKYHDLNICSDDSFSIWVKHP
jgi:hypothetical protein